MAANAIMWDTVYKSQKMPINQGFLTVLGRRLASTKQFVLPISRNESDRLSLSRVRQRLLTRLGEG